jgi:hypothetical protein
MKEIETLFTKFHFFIVDEKRIYVVHHKVLRTDDSYGEALYFRNVINDNPYRASMFWSTFKDFIMTGRAKMLVPKPEVIMSYTFGVNW